MIINDIEEQIKKMPGADLKFLCDTVLKEIDRREQEDEDYLDKEVFLDIAISNLEALREVLREED